MEEMKDLVIIEAEAKKELELAMFLAQDADNFTIITDDGVQIAKDNIIFIRKKSKDIDNIRVSITKPLDELKKKIKALYDAPITTLTNAMNVYSKTMQVWLMEQAKIADKEARRLQAIADEKARKEQEKLEKKATKAEESGKPERAEALREQKEMVVPEAPVVVEPELPKGAYWKDNWSVQIIDGDKIPREYLIPNEKMLSQLAVTTKGTLKIAGVAFENRRTLVNRS